jgi:hypothetical protein
MFFNFSRSSKTEQTKTNISNKNENEEPHQSHVSKYLHNKSFFNLTTIILKNIQLNAPFPQELNFEEVINNIIGGKFLEGYLVKDNEGVFCKNEEIVQRQSGIFTEMAKQLAKGFFKSGTVSISLPIRIFEPRSMLERYSDWWSFAPILLKKAGNTSDKIEAFKYSICFVLSAMFLSTGQMKPFNPLLGETFEGSFDDGTKIYLEHTCHTPCISHYLVTDPVNDYIFSGYCDISIEGTFKMLYNNSITMVQKGKNNIYLKKTKQTISYQLPKVIIGGVVLGSRYVLLDGHMKFDDRENNIKAVIYFNKHHQNIKSKRIHDLYGQIFYNEYSKKNEVFYEDKSPKNAFPSDKKLIYSEITGSWLENLIFDNKIYWSIEDSSPPKISPIKNVMPSDCRFREDLIWLKRSLLAVEYNTLYENYAQKWKVALEVQQRHDRSLRETRKKK